MGNKLKIGIKYCGNCNPKIDGPALVIKLTDRMPNIVLLSADNSGRDFLLIVSGCEVDCATRPKQVMEPVIVVAGLTLDSIPYSENELLNELVKKLEVIK